MLCSALLLMHWHKTYCQPAELIPECTGPNRPVQNVPLLRRGILVENSKILMSGTRLSDPDQRYFGFEVGA